MPIQIEDVSYIYLEGTPFQQMALNDVSLTISDAQIVGIMGKTGSGKSTLLQLLNGLLRPTSGRVLIDGMDTRALNKKDLIKLRQKVGLVMQNPEQQIFEITVFEEVGFGPKNADLDYAEIEQRVEEALLRVGLSYEDFKSRPTNSLSSGEKRRVAIAGILALGPEYLLLDEPSAGLDLDGKVGLLHYLTYLNKQKGTTIVLVSHDLDYLLEICHKIIILHEGKIWAELDGEDGKTDWLEIEKLGFSLPDYLKLAYMLKGKHWLKGIISKSRQQIIQQVVESVNSRL
ncbi:MAG: ATP-binding cassette domain-containing protein [Syntrophomonadaceae bacterium]|nr:ATP-binding cassette domain-containing protein [Syntrophomonadaceae bacterium]